MSTSVQMSKEEADKFIAKIEYYLERLSKEGSIPVIVLTPSRDISMGITDGLDNLPNPVVVFAEPIQKNVRKSLETAQFMAQLLGAVIVTTFNLEEEFSIFHYHMINVPVLSIDVDPAEVTSLAESYKEFKEITEETTGDIVSWLMTESVLDQGDEWTRELKNLHKGYEKSVTEIRDNLAQLFKN